MKGRNIVVARADDVLKQIEYWVAGDNDDINNICLHLSMPTFLKICIEPLDMLLCENSRINSFESKLF